METRWRGMVIVDYEIGLPESATLELELYSRGLVRVPEVLLGEPRAWGRERRPGITEVPEQDYDLVSARVADRTLDLDAVAAIRGRAERLMTAVAGLLEDAERQAASAAPMELAPLAEAMLALMALHVVNWMWPTARFEQLAASALGNADLGHRAVLALQVPAAPAYMLDFHQRVLTGVQESAGEPGRVVPAAARLADALGYLQRPAMPRLAAQPWESPDHLASVVADWLGRTDQAELARQGELLRAAHQRSQAGRRAMCAALLAGASGDYRKWRQVQAMVEACGLAADAEERRKVLQLRFLRLVRALAESRGFPQATMTVAELCRRAAVTSRGSMGSRC